MTEFKGLGYVDTIKWNSIIPVTGAPLKYLEIGSLCGKSALSFASVYGSHPDTQIHCVDPWINYEEYKEYRVATADSPHDQKSNYSHFLENVSASASATKIYPHRGFSHQILPTFPDETFDILFIDGNHQTINVLEDSILAFRKVKKGGFLVFDDVADAWPTVIKGVQLFLGAYESEFDMIEGTIHGHLFCRKKKV